MISSESNQERDTRWAGAWRTRPQAYEDAARSVSRLGWLYVSRFLHERKPEELVDLLARLGSRDLLYLRNVRFLESSEVHKFLASAPELLRRLPQSTNNTTGMAREVRGRVDWAATTKQRLAAGGDASLFIVSQTRRHFDVAENRVLAYLLKRIADTSGLVRRSRSAASGLEANRMLGAAGLSSLGPQGRPTAMDLQALRLSRREDFRRALVPLLKVHDQIFADDISILRQVLGERVWLPPEPDKLFELWCLFALLESLLAAGWGVIAASLIGAPGGSSPTFSLAKGPHEICISYQSTPSTFLTNSRYRQILDAYDIGGANRRPDLIVTANGSAGKLYLLIEVKLTEDREYVVDSVYKVLGYISDFSSSLTLSPEPKGILVIWDGVQSVDLSHTLGVGILTAESLKQGGLVGHIERLAEQSGTAIRGADC